MSLSSFRKSANDEPAVYTPAQVPPRLLRKRKVCELSDGYLTEFSFSDDGSDGNGMREPAAAPQVDGTQGKAAATAPASRKQRQKERKACRRRAKRSKDQGGDPDTGSKIKDVTKKRRVESTQDPIEGDFDITEITQPGCVRSLLDLPEHDVTRAELEASFGLKYFCWDGLRTRLLLDREHRVIGALLGQPRGANWLDVCDGALSVLQQMEAKLKLSAPSPKEEEEHRCEGGKEPQKCHRLHHSVHHGISFREGQQEPTLMAHGSRKMDCMLDTLMENPSIQQICSFASNGFNAYSSRAFTYLEATVKAIRAHQPELQKKYDNKIGVFPCRSFNLGGNTATYPHLDKRTQSWCSITALGTFDPDFGGDLVLWDFGLTIRFPPGSTVLIPSSLLVHSNAAIMEGEKRYSIAQYVAGGIFRWADNGLKTEEDWLKNHATGEDVGEKERQCWTNTINMFSTLKELAEE